MNRRDVAEAAALKASEISMKYFRGELQKEYKAHEFDVVTQADKESEEAIREIIIEHFPDDSILGEEFDTREGNSGYLWVLDPVDGTQNYSTGIPVWGVNVAVLDGEGVLAAVTSHPAFDEFFVAERGKGTTMNGEPVHVSEVENLRKGLVVHEVRAHSEDFETAFDNHKKLTGNVGSLRDFGAASYQMTIVANGNFVGFAAEGMKPWDVAAGSLLVQEAGGKVTAIDGSPWVMTAEKALNTKRFSFIASNGKVHDQILEVLK